MVKKTNDIKIDERNLDDVTGGAKALNTETVSQMDFEMMEADEHIDELKGKLKDYKKNGRSKKQAAVKLLMDFRNMDHYADLNTCRKFVDKYWDKL